MNFKDGDLIIVNEKCYRISGSTLVPADNEMSIKNVALKELKDHPGKEFTIYGNTGISDHDSPSIVTYLGSRSLKGRYYHELSRNTLVEIVEFSSEGPENE